MSLLLAAPRSPCRLRLSCWSGRVLCEGCLVQSWWTHDAAVLRRCCHGWSGGMSTVSLAEDPWLASALAFHLPPRSGHCRRGSVQWMIVHVNWIVCVAMSKNVTIMYVSRQSSQWKVELDCRCLGSPRSATLKTSWQLWRGNFLQTLLKERGSRWFRHIFMSSIPTSGPLPALTWKCLLKTKVKLALDWTQQSLLTFLPTPTLTLMTCLTDET